MMGAGGLTTEQQKQMAQREQFQDLADSVGFGPEAGRPLSLLLLKCAIFLIFFSHVVLEQQSFARYADGDQGRPRGFHD